MAQAQLQIVEQRAYAEDGTLIHPQLLERYRRIATISVNYAGNEAEYNPRLHAHFDLVLAAVAAGRAELLRLHRGGQIEDAILHELERDLDLEELAAQSAKM
jgi:CPA1 family monovalent cation:H+ antiporter